MRGDVHGSHVNRLCNGAVQCQLMRFNTLPPDTTWNIIAAMEEGGSPWDGKAPRTIITVLKLTSNRRRPFAIRLQP